MTKPGFLLLILLAPAPARAADPLTAEAAAEAYRETFRPLPQLDCPPGEDGEIVVCARRADRRNPNRLPLPVEPGPGEPRRVAGEPPTGSDALAAGRCLQRCRSFVGVTLKLVPGAPLQVVDSPEGGD